ncbi:MAG: hypothetical protein SFZ23_08240 [Planctomycetota bacterium]|nr:hypothetical protein [Planctomycetota bacterium]
MKIALLAIAGLAAAANAQTVASWVLLGQPGNQPSVAGVGSANVTANPLARGAGLAGNSGSNSLNTSGWADLGANDFISLGFTVAAGYQTDLSQLYIGTRSSGTGPGFLGLFYSGDGFSTNLFSFIQPDSTFVNSVIDLSALPNLTGNVEFRLRALNNTSANGGAISANGTFRVTAYFVNGQFDRDTQFTGTTTLIPAPGAVALMGLGGLVAGRRRR